MFRCLQKFYFPVPAGRLSCGRPSCSRPRIEWLEERQLLSTFRVRAGDDLQAILNNVAMPGDTLLLDAGATFVGPITLPNKPGNQWITIASSALDSLPGPGQRVGPEDAGFMPKIVSPGLAEPALQTAAGAHNYRLVGLEFLPQTPTAFIYDLITLGDGSSAQTALDQVPHDLILDQCYIHAWPQQDLKRGIALNSADTSILDSYLADFKSVGLDSQAIAGWNGPGPFHIDNNYLEAAGENILFGGDVAQIPNLVPSNIDILDNEFFKPLTWKADDPSYAGIPWTIKNLLELKNASHVLIAGNLFENNWIASQDGFAILFTVRDQNGAMPWATVTDVTFQNNLLQHVAAGFNISGTDNGPSGRTTQIRIQNNLLEDIGGSWGNGDLLEILDGANDIVVDHNTAFPTHTVVEADGIPSTGFVYQNNIATYGLYGIKGSDRAPGTDSLGQYLPGAVVTNNVFVGQPSQALSYPSGNFFAGALADVGFVDAGDGNYRLAASSPYIAAGSDGSALGADIDAILATMNTFAVPQAPTGLTAVAVSPSQINLAWNSVAGALSYAIERSPDGSSGWVQLGTTAAGITTFQDSALPAGTTWFYRVRAANLAGDSDYSAPAAATTFVVGGASSLVLAGLPSSLTAGTVVTFTVTATDADGKPVTAFFDTIHFSSSDPQAVLPADYTFTANDNGVHTFSVTLKTAGSSALSATDLTASSVAGSQVALLIVAAPAASLQVAGFPSPARAGMAASFTVTAADPFGNVATGYVGTVHFSSSDRQAILPADYTFTAADQGVHSFSATFKTAGILTLTAADLAVPLLAGAQAAINVDPAPASRLAVAGFPSSLTAGTSASFTITAEDPFGNIATSYRGTVHILSSDPQARGLEGTALPANYTFTAADRGVHTFSATLETAGTQSITAYDLVLPGLTGTQGNIVVNPAALKNLRLAGLPTLATAGTVITFTLTATDAYGNTETSYRGTVHFSSSDRQALLPADYTFTAADKGVHSFSITVKTAGTQTLAAADTVAIGLARAQAATFVNPAVARTFLVSGFPASAVRGIAYSFTVSAKDSFGNTATGYRGTVHFTSSDRAAILPSNYTFTAADKGLHLFSAILETLGLQSLSASDTLTSTLTGTEAGILVTAAGGALPPPGTTAAPTAQPSEAAPETAPFVAAPIRQLVGGSSPDIRPADGGGSEPRALPAPAASSTSLEAGSQALVALESNALAEAAGE